MLQKNIKEQNPNLPQIPDQPFRLLIIRGSGSGKTNSLFNLIINLYQLLISKNDLNHLNDSKAFIEYSNNMDDIYKNILEYNPNKKRKILIVSYMIADILSNEKPNQIVTELFTRGRKLNISFAFITQSYFAVRKNIRLSSTHYFVMKIPSKRQKFNCV